MSNVPKHWSTHSREAVNDQVEALLAGITIPAQVTDDRRCAIIQACGHIAINLICDLAAAVPGSNIAAKVKDSMDGIRSLAADMLNHIGRRFLPPN